MKTHRRAWLALFWLVIAGGLAIVFLPLGWMLNRLTVELYYMGRRLGIPRAVPLEAYDVALNMLLFAVPTALAAALWPQVRAWVWIVVAAAASITIELVQYLALPREASVQDVLANVAGAVVGVAAVAGIRALIR